MYADYVFFIKDRYLVWKNALACVTIFTHSHQPAYIRSLPMLKIIKDHTVRLLERNKLTFSYQVRDMVLPMMGLVICLPLEIAYVRF